LSIIAISTEEDGSQKMKQKRKSVSPDLSEQLNRKAKGSKGKRLCKLPLNLRRRTPKKGYIYKNPQGGSKGKSKTNEVFGLICKGEDEIGTAYLKEANRGPQVEVRETIEEGEQTI